MRNVVAGSLRDPVMAVLMMVLMFGGAARAVESATLIGDDLHAQSIKFVGLSGGELTYFNADRQLQRADAAQFVSLSFTDEAAPADAAEFPALMLNDGHLFRGKFAGVDEAGKVQWDTSDLGRLTFKLDDIARMNVSEIETPPAPAPGAASTTATPAPPPAANGPVSANDRVTLRNGDVISGFIESVQTTGLNITVEQNQKLTLTWDRVARLALANPVRAKPGVWVRLAGGSRLRVEKLAIDSKQMAGEVLGKSVALPREQVSGIDFAQRHRLMRLGEIESEVTGGGSVFGVPMKPQATIDGVYLHAPVSVTYHLPEGVRRFAATARLDPQGLDWADLNLIVEDGKGMLAQWHLNGAQPSAEVNIVPRDRTLVVQLDDGANGPVFDRLVLSGAYLLIDVQP
ncbi:MAG: hypothetical protein GC162_13705 [Planctomycetes bacterium]|nr:hypothetical protein [Planctomycetota bacterium]